MFSLGNSWIESEVPETGTRTSAGFWEEKKRLKQLLGNEVQSPPEMGKQISEDHWSPSESKSKYVQ